MGALHNLRDVHLTRAPAREWGRCYGGHVDEDSPIERACVREYNLPIAAGASRRAYNTHM
jgi:hypothetical protein